MRQRGLLRLLKIRQQRRRRENPRIVIRKTEPLGRRDLPLGRKLLFRMVLRKLPPRPRRHRDRLDPLQLPPEFMRLPRGQFRQQHLRRPQPGDLIAHLPL